MLNSCFCALLSRLLTDCVKYYTSFLNGSLEVSFDDLKQERKSLSKQNVGLSDEYNNSADHSNNRTMISKRKISWLMNMELYI